MKPAVIYSYIVETLRDCRSGVRGWASRCDASRNLQAHTFDCILAECKAAVEERRDIANFRGVCEDIFEKVLRLRLHLAEADANGINPKFKEDMVMKGMMFRHDQCHKVDEVDADPKGFLKSFETESNRI